MYAGYGSGEDIIDVQEEKRKWTIPYLSFNYKEMWIGNAALNSIVKVGESLRSYAIKVLFIVAFMIVLKISYSIG